ncbi:MAG: WD40 repeat domain-containing protein [Anaerolineales bacterium]
MKIKNNLKNVWVGAISAVIVLLILAVIMFSRQSSLNAQSAQLAYVQANAKADQFQEKIVRANELADLAVSQRDKQFDLSLLLSVEAFRTADTVATRSVLLDNTIRLRNMGIKQPTGQPLTSYPDDSYITSTAFSPDGKMIASGDTDGTITLWDVSTHQPIGQLFAEPVHMVYSLAFSPDGKTLASGNEDGTLVLWNTSTRQTVGQPFIESTAPIPISSVAFSPDGKILASGNIDKTIILWDVAIHQPIGKPLLGDTGPVLSVAFSPDGKTLASGGCGKFSLNLTCSKGEIVLWDVVTRQPMGQPFRGHTDWVSSVTFSPDGKTLASGSSDNSIILWNVATRQPIGLPLNGYLAAVFSLAFSSDGKTLASDSSENIIILWDVNPESWIENICQQVGRNFTHAEWIQYFPNDEYRATCPQWPLEPEATSAP